MRCAMTDLEYPEFSDGIWDDGEWISWDWINQNIHEQESRARFPKADPDLIDIFERLVSAAQDHKFVTGKYLQIWGELGELYAEIKYGVKRHRPHVQGSDGKIGDDYIEVKTISPEKSNQKVQVKRGGNFSKLLIVKISAEFEFDSRMIDRQELGKGAGKFARTTWKQAPKDAK